MPANIKKLFLTVNTALLILFFMGNTYGTNTSPVGFWRTYSDISGNASGVVRIWETDGKLYGKIVKIYPVDGNNPKDLCVKCTDPIVNKYLNKPILGITFLWDLKHNSEDNVWNGGWVLDPKIGKIYRCKLTLIDDGKKLNVRGYIGITLLGRTQTWERINEPK